MGLRGSREEAAWGWAVMGGPSGAGGPSPGSCPAPSLPLTDSLTHALIHSENLRAKGRSAQCGPRRCPVVTAAVPHHSRHG